MAKTKIIIAGIGGVGGYFGGLLAKCFFNSKDVEVNFLARGQHLACIRENGLKVLKGEAEFIARPAIATDDPCKLGTADLIIVATKSYDLEAVMVQLRPSIGPDTIILPLLNGIDNSIKIKNIFPLNIVLQGCVYIVSRLKQAGVIENNGNIQKLYFGVDTLYNDQLYHLEQVFKQAGIDAAYVQNITDIIWEKFIFLSPVATATSYYNKCIGELLLEDECVRNIAGLIKEVKLIAAINKINVAEDIADITWNKLKALPFATTSSMHTDFNNKKPQTELQSLTGYVVNKAVNNNINTPVYNKMYEKLNKKIDL